MGFQFLIVLLLFFSAALLAVEYLSGELKVTVDFGKSTSLRLSE